MFERTRVLDLELSAPMADLDGLQGYGALLGLVRLRGEPLGYVRLAVRGGRVPAPTLREAVEAQLAVELLRASLAERLTPEGAAEPYPAGAWPAISVAVCTRDRPAALATCLEALCELDYPGELELLVVDNAPADAQTARLVHERFPRVRYLREDRPGLNWARNRAILEARGAIVAYTDDDVVVDCLWARGLARAFAEPGVVAVAGLVAPLELETAAQAAFERYGGFGRGFTRRWYGANRAAGERAAAEHSATGKFGTGANMAYRRDLFLRIGGFDPALDVGTATNGGGDLELFFRVIRAGFPLLYEPRALVRHRHRRDDAALRRQIANNGVGFYAYLVRCFRHFPDERLPIARQGLWWFLYWYLYRLALAFFRPTNATPALILAELRGGIVGLGRYQQARRVAAAMARPGDLPCTLVSPGQGEPGLRPQGVAVRVVDLAAPLAPLDDVAPYSATRVLVQRAGVWLGQVDLANLYLPVSVTRLREAIIDQLGGRLLAEASAPLPAPGEAAARVCAAGTPRAAGALSVIIITLDQPADLLACLTSLAAARAPVPLELIVVDRNPASGLTAPVLAAFPGVRHLGEPGASQARALSRGSAAAAGAIVITLDQAAVVPSGWPMPLIAPFVDEAVVAVVGAQLPAELETPAQRLAEEIRRPTTDDRQPQGHDPVDVDGLAALSASGHAAFRAALLAEPLVGALDEALGHERLGGAAVAHLLYRATRAGHRVVAAPEAAVLVRRGRALGDYLRAAEAAAAGRVALALTLALREGDGRELWRLVREGPRHYAAKLGASVRGLLRGRPATPAPALLAELRGTLAAPWLLLMGNQAARRSAEHGASQASGSPAPVERGA